jgi:hypothetical protein
VRRREREDDEHVNCNRPRLDFDLLDEGRKHTYTEQLEEDIPIFSIANFTTFPDNPLVQFNQYHLLMKE